MWGVVPALAGMEPALAPLQDARSLYAKAEIGVSPNQAETLVSDGGNLANVFVLEGKMRAAEKMYLKALALCERSSCATNGQVDRLRTGLISVYRAERRETEAARLEKSFQ